MKNGAAEAYITRHTDFIGDMLVECPKCQKRALVKTPGYPQQDLNIYDEQVRFSCFHCGRALRYKDRTKPVAYTNSRGRPVHCRVFFDENSKTDIFFGYTLWLIAPSIEGYLWAYNEEHLQFLEEFIAAPLRRRPQEEMYNHSIGSRLPKWMTSAKNRDEILKTIQLLKLKK